MEHESIKCAVKSSLIFSFDGLTGGILRKGETERDCAGERERFLFATLSSGTGEVACADCRKRILDRSRCVAANLDVPVEAGAGFDLGGCTFGIGAFESALLALVFVACLLNR